jgi:hypothetical protein
MYHSIVKEMDSSARGVNEVIREGAFENSRLERAFSA